ncbi:MAG: Gldg family protein [Zavarzinella sp.]
MLIAGIVFLLGMLWSFLVLQLGRGQERRNAVIRRVIYGFNSLFVSVLLAFVILVVNTIFFYQFPTPFVTNETAFQGLSEPTQKYLEKLETPIQIYMILSSNEEVEIQSRYGPYVYSNLYSDMRGLLSQCAELNKNIKVEYLSPGIDVTRVNLVLEEFRRSNVENEKQLGIYLAVGEGGARKSIVSIQDVMSLAQPRPGSQPFPVFVGETVLMSEIAYLVDGRENEKIYFTQAHGELGMEAKQDDPHTMAEVIRALRAEKIQVEPLRLDEKDPKVPDDAAVVVVAGPRQTITNDSPTYKALEDYLKRRNGRLLAFLPAIKGVDQRVSPTGLEPLLGGFGVDLSPDTRLIVSPPGYILGERFKLPGNMIIAEWDKRFREPVAAIYNQIPIFGIDSRRVAPMSTEGPFLVQSVYNTVPISRGGIWQEASYESSIQTVWEQMLQQGQPILEAKRFTMEPVSVAVAVSDRPATQEAKPIPRMVVFGSDLMLLDNSQIGRFVGPEKQAALVSQSIDWLRQRNINLGIPLKKPNSYQLPTGTEKSTYLYLLLLATVIIGGGGLSVWYLRQK